MAEELSGKQIDKAGVGKTSSSKWLWYVGSAVLVGGGVAAYLFLKPGETPPPTVDKLSGPPSLP